MKEWGVCHRFNVSVGSKGRTRAIKTWSVPLFLHYFTGTLEFLAGTAAALPLHFPHNTAVVGLPTTIEYSCGVTSQKKRTGWVSACDGRRILTDRREARALISVNIRVVDIFHLPVYSYVLRYFFDDFSEVHSFTHFTSSQQQ
jgi:hypothetical protein